LRKNGSCISDDMANCIEMRPVPESFVWTQAEVLNSADTSGGLGCLSVSGFTISSELHSCMHKWMLRCMVPGIIIRWTNLAGLQGCYVEDARPMKVYSRKQPRPWSYSRTEKSDILDVNEC
jgi:hypothetical protein